MVTEDSPQIQAGPEERCELLLCLLKDHYNGLMEFAFKHGAFLSLGIGWIITSDSARKFIADNLVARTSLCGFVLLMTILHAMGAHRFWVRSDIAFKQFVAVGYMPKEYVEFRKISLSTVTSVIVTHALAALVIFFLLLSLVNVGSF